MQLMISDNDLCVGSIMEAAAQMHRVSQGIVEITNYLKYNRDILWSDSEHDICHLYMNLATELSKRSKDIKPCQDKMLSIHELMRSLQKRIVLPTFSPMPTMKRKKSVISKNCLIPINPCLILHLQTMMRVVYARKFQKYFMMHTRNAWLSSWNQVSVPLRFY